MKKRLLVVEDDAGIRDGLTDLLQEEGYAVSLANNGKEALGVLNQDPRFNLILLDLMMPIMDGTAFLEMLERHRPEILRAIPIVLLTAAGDRAANVKNVKAVVRKPIDINHLLDTVVQYGT